jgi:hypothetical protein
MKKPSINGMNGKINLNSSKRYGICMKPGYFCQNQTTKEAGSPARPGKPAIILLWGMCRNHLPLSRLYLSGHRIECPHGRLRVGINLCLSLPVMRHYNKNDHERLRLNCVYRIHDFVIWVSTVVPHEITPVVISFFVFLFHI